MRTRRVSLVCELAVLLAVVVLVLFVWQDTLTVCSLSRVRMSNAAPTLSSYTHRYTHSLTTSHCHTLTESVNVSEISTGRCVAKLTDKDVDMEDVDMIDCSKPLDNVTALYYNEDTNEIVTGTQTGRIHVWTN